MGIEGRIVSKIEGIEISFDGNQGNRKRSVNPVQKVWRMVLYIESRNS